MSLFVLNQSLFKCTVKLNPFFGTEEFVQIRQVFGLHSFKLHRHSVDVTVKSVWFKQVFWFTHGFV